MTTQREISSFQPPLIDFPYLGIGGVGEAVEENERRCRLPLPLLLFLHQRHSYHACHVKKHISSTAIDVKYV